jgi:peptidoglycan hydrolase-like protein with peptidoglycan-binding domain
MSDNGRLDDPFDGKFGPLTKAALTKFQEDSKIEATGKMDLRTVKAIVDKLGIMRISPELIKKLQEIMPNIMTFFLKKEHDGRSQSANLEQQVLTTIKDHLLGKYPSWMIELTGAREFYDIKINGIHINLKLTAGKSAERWCSIFRTPSGCRRRIPWVSTAAVA